MTTPGAPTPPDGRFARIGEAIAGPTAAAAKFIGRVAVTGFQTSKDIAHNLRVNHVENVIDRLERKQEVSQYLSEVALSRLSSGAIAAPTPLALETRGERRKAMKLENKLYRRDQKAEQERRIRVTAGNAGRYSRRKTVAKQKYISHTARQMHKDSIIDAHTAFERIKDADLVVEYKSHYQDKAEKKTRKSGEEAYRYAYKPVVSRLRQRRLNHARAVHARIA